MAGCVEGAPWGACWVMLSRRVSGRPGAEGAPFDGWGREMGMRVVVLVVWVAGVVWGAMRRDWVCWLFVSVGCSLMDFLTSCLVVS